MFKNSRLFYAAASVSLMLIVSCYLLYENSQNKTYMQSNKPVQPLNHHQFDAVQTKMVQLMQQQDPKASFDYLRTNMQKNPAIARDCHPLLHYVGQAAYKKYKEFNTAMNFQDEMCNSGYIHGVIEAYFVSTNDVQTALQTACLDQGERKITFGLWQCYHGVGHGVMYSTGKNLAQSLALCESLSSNFGSESCANGVFMERFIIVDHSGVDVPNASNFTAGLCGQQEPAYKIDCYIYAPAAYLARHTNDYSGAFKDCSKVEVAYISNCVYGVGGEVMKENITRPGVVANFCKKETSKYAESCLSGAINILINQTGSTSSVMPLCNSTFSQFSSMCSEQIKKWNSTFGS